METIIYRCPQCGHPVSFFRGFTLICKTSKQGNPAHSFKPKDTENE